MVGLTENIPKYVVYIYGIYYNMYTLKMWCNIEILTLQSASYTSIWVIITSTVPYNTPLVWYVQFTFYSSYNILYLNPHCKKCGVIFNTAEY